MLMQHLPQLEEELLKLEKELPAPVLLETFAQLEFCTSSSSDFLVHREKCFTQLHQEQKRTIKSVVQLLRDLLFNIKTMRT